MHTSVSEPGKRTFPQFCVHLGLGYAKERQMSQNRFHYCNTGEAGKWWRRGKQFEKTARELSEIWKREALSKKEKTNIWERKKEGWGGSRRGMGIRRRRDPSRERETKWGK